MSLSVNDLVSAQVILSPTAAPSATFGTLLILGCSPVIDVSERFRNYSTLTGVASDFGTNTPEYLAAAAFFGQSPQPATCMIGRWAQTASSGILHGGILSSSQQALSNFTAVTSGGMSISIDGSAVSLSGLNFSSVTNLNGVASIISTALTSHGSCVWNASLGRFEFSSASSGTPSTVGFATAPGSGVDISGLVAATAASGANAVAGIAAETFLNAVTILASASTAWYGVTPAATSMPSDDSLVAAAQAIEAFSPKRLLVVTTQDTAAMNPSSTTDLAARLQAAALSHTAAQYSSKSPYAAASLFARQATVDFTANNSTITLMYKQEPGITAEDLTETQAAALKAKNCNVFAKYNNATAIIQWGTVASGQFIDTIVGTDWLQNALQTALFNTFYTSPTKLSQTDAGVNILVTAAEAVLSQALQNGLIAPGVWTGPALGKIVNGQTLPKGYYIYAPAIATQTQAQRGARQAPTMSVAIKLGGAIHTAAVLVEVNQ